MEGRDVVMGDSETQTSAGVRRSIPFDPAQPLVIALYVVAVVLLLAAE